jgi:hypothetical protein
MGRVILLSLVSRVVIVLEHRLLRMRQVALLLLVLVVVLVGAAVLEVEVLPVEAAKAKVVRA